MPPLELIAAKLKRAVKRESFNFDTYLRKQGFVAKNSLGCGYRYIFIHNKMGVVVKRPYLSSGSVRVPPNGVKTLVVRARGYSNLGCKNIIFIQPLVDVSRAARQKAMNILAEWESDYRGIVHDLHSDNVGMYRGKAVRIDW